MAVQIVTSVPRGPFGRRLRRMLVMGLGLLLTLAGLLLLTPLLLVLLISIAFWDFSAVLEAVAKPGMLLLSAGGLFGFFLGTRLRRGRRRMVLFLRRFGFKDASEALTFAVGTAVGRRWRLVTLDDAEIAPVGVRKRTRRLVHIASWLLLAAVIWGVGSGIRYLHGGGAEDQLKQIFDQAFEQARASGENVFAAVLGAIIVGILVGLLVLMLVMMGIFIPTAFAGSLTLFSWRSWRAVRKAERSKSMEITTEEDIQGVAKAVLRRTRQIFAPRLVVVRVVDAVWKQAVRALGDTASVVLIDVSEPSNNLLWEVKSLKPEIRSHWILVGQEDQVKKWATSQRKNGLVGQLRKLLDGETVLAYQGTERKETRMFSASLRACLENLELTD